MTNVCKVMLPAHFHDTMIFGKNTEKNNEIKLPAGLRNSANLKKV